MKLETGKLDSELLKKIVFGKITYRSDDVSVRPGIGEDCAVMDFGDHDPAPAMFSRLPIP